MRPPLALVVSPGTSQRVAALVVALARWCRPQAWPGHEWDGPVLASSPAAAAAVAGSSGPMAVWVANAAESAEAAMAGKAAFLVSDDPSLGESAVLVAGGGVDVSGLDAVPDFVRARWRRRFGLPEPLSVDLTDGPLPEHLVPTALALCSSVLALQSSNLGRAAGEVAERLGLLHPDRSPVGAMARCLAELDTPPRSPVVAGAAAVLRADPSLPWPAVTGRHPALEAELVRELAAHLGHGGHDPSPASPPPLAGRLLRAVAGRLSPSARRAVERLVSGQARQVSALQTEVDRLRDDVARLDAELELLRAERSSPR